MSNAMRYVLGHLPVPEARDSRPRLATAHAVWNHVLPEMKDAQREIFRVLCVDSRRRLIVDVVVAVGSVDSCFVDPREVFAPAIVAKASGVVLCHCHPSGDPEPSIQDVQLTQQLRQAGELLCIRVIDHVVVTDKGYVSMAQRLMMGGGH